MHLFILSVRGCAQTANPASGPTERATPRLTPALTLNMTPSCRRTRGCVLTLLAAHHLAPLGWELRALRPLRRQLASWDGAAAAAAAEAGALVASEAVATLQRPPQI